MKMDGFEATAIMSIKVGFDEVGPNLVRLYDAIVVVLDVVSVGITA